MRASQILLTAGLVVGAACGGGSTGPKPITVASVGVQAPGTMIPVGGTLQLVALPRDARGVAITGLTPTWTTSQASVATVSSTGLVTGILPGQATLSATVAGVSGSFTVTVSGTPNLAIVRAWLTQGTQRPDGSIPLVQGGLPALLNVVGSVTSSFASAPPPIRVRVYEGGELRFEDIRPMSGPGSPTPDDGNPIHQVLIPASAILPGMTVEVLANPDGTVPEERLDDNAWPSSGGPRLVAVRSVAPLEVHMVPVLLTVGGSVGNVSPATLDEYLMGVRQMFPLGQVSATIGTVFSTDVDFGTGQPAAWVQILPQLDMLRVIEGTTRYYVGAIRPPAGVTFVQNGGWGYIPGNPLHAGAASRTSLVVGVGWFNRQSATLELVAHELAHNHSRRHAPCGNPAGPDAGYPHMGGALGVWTHDIYSFSAGLAQTIRSLGPQVGFDIMSYCNPVWTSDYTYQALLEVRSAMVVAAPAPAEPCDCLMVWGTDSGAGLELGPVFETRAHVALPAGAGTHVLEGVDDLGRVVYSARFTPAEIDHAPGVRQFLFAIPRATAGGDALVALRASDPAGRVALAPPGDVLAPPIVARRLPGEGVELTWDPVRAPGVLVRDPASGRVLGLGRSGRLVVQADLPTLEVTESRGMRSWRSLVTPP